MNLSTRILYVDGDTNFAELAAAYLDQRDHAYEVIVEDSPTSALDKLVANSSAFDCLILEYSLPEMTGVELIQTIRAKLPDFSVPIIMFTGQGSEAIAAAALNAGASSYVIKEDSNTFEHLAQRVRMAVETKQKTQIQEHIGTLAERAGDPIYVLNNRGQFIYVNDAFVSLVGYSRKRMLGSNPSLIKDEAAVELAENKLRELLSDDGPNSVTFEIAIQPKTGAPIPCQDHMTLIPYNTEQFQGTVGVLRDLSQLKDHETELAQYKRLVKNLPIGVYRTTPGPDGDFRLVNQGLVDIFKAGSEVYFNHVSVSDLYVDAEERKSFSDQLLKDGVVHKKEIYMRTVDGRPIWCEVSGIAVEENDKIVFELALQDITERKEREQRLAVFNRLLRHNLRNGMNVIRGRADLIGDSLGGDDELQTHVASIKQRTDELITIGEKAGVVRSLFDDGRALSPTHTVEQLLDACTTAFERTYPDATLRLSDSDSEILRSKMDPRLEIALTEILDNAVIHNDQSTAKIALSANAADSQRPGEWIEIRITDNGPGIPEHEQKIIEIGNETPLQHGTGLGLWLIYWTVSLLGGHITVEANSPSGSCVVLTLPRKTST